MGDWPARRADDHMRTTQRKAASWWYMHVSICVSVPSYNYYVTFLFAYSHRRSNNGSLFILRAKSNHWASC